MEHLARFTLNYRNKAVSLVFMILLALIPLFIANDYYIHVLITLGLFIILSLSLNLVSGYTGQLSIGHAAFYGIGAYVTALLMLKLNLSFLVAIPIGGLVTAFFGLLLGLPTMRLAGDYLAIVTLGFGEIVRLVLLNWDKVTRGPMGLPGIPAPELGSYVFMSKIPYYYTVFIIVLITVATMRRIVNSGFGLSLIAISQDELAAEAVGINTLRCKIISFIISAFFAGIAGGFFAVYISFVSPDSFTFMDSIMVLEMVVLGGLASIPGSIIGAVVLGLIPEILRFMAEYRMLIFGALMVVIVIFKPDGFWSAKKRMRNAIMKDLAARKMIDTKTVSPRGEYIEGA
ncbi:branched-chain amino acid ABC transporter permease [Desulfotruncus alcoholivorax]|uniref:branched-chain amino acid ABC transporter permease n=1 Tax=Desulfotruncus alcoholivorax TaxID=265477 RepID=UPI001EE5F9A1|nr:branched-chain amino acid ABC transporter permease [Desulfotruncus alcoholivorax]